MIAEDCPVMLVGQIVIDWQCRAGFPVAVCDDGSTLTFFRDEIRLERVGRETRTFRPTWDEAQGRYEWRS